MDSFCIIMAVVVAVAHNSNALLVPSYGIAAPITVTHHYSIPYVRHILPYRVPYPRTAIRNHVRSYQRETGHLSDTSVVHPFKTRKLN